MPELEPNTTPAKSPIVELGAKSLIFIALIVGVCSGAGRQGDMATQRDIERLQKTVERLEKKVDALAPPATNTAPK